MKLYWYTESARKVANAAADPLGSGFAAPLLRVIIMAACLGLTVHGVAHAATGGQPPAADLAALRGVTLDATFLRKWLTIGVDPKAPRQAIDLLTLKQGDGPKSLDAMVATLSARPGAAAYLAQQGLTAREYVLGGTALMAAALDDMTALHPELAPEGAPGAPATTPANLAFFRAHKNEIHQVMQAEGRRRLQADMAKSGSTMTVAQIKPCVIISVVTVTLASLHEPGTAKAPAASKTQIAQGLADMAKPLAEQNLRDDITDIGDEIRRQAAAPQFQPTTRFAHGLDDMTAWAKANCH